MKRIINGLTYNTDTSTVIARSVWVDEDRENRGGDRITSVLYQTRGGAFFVHRETLTIYRDLRTEKPAERVLNEFVPLTRDEAERWTRRGQIELLNDVFGEPPEASADATLGATLYIRVPTTLKNRIEAAAGADSLSVNAWAIRCMEGCLTSRRTA